MASWLPLVSSPANNSGNISRIIGNKIAIQIHKYHPILIIISRNIFFLNSKQNGGEGRFTAHCFLYRNLNLLSNGLVNPLLPNSD